MLETIIAALLGSLECATAGKRIRMFQLEKGDLDKGPCLVVNRITGTPNNFLGGSFTNPTLVQIDSYARSRPACKTLADGCETFLKDYVQAGGGIYLVRPATGNQDEYEPETQAHRIFMQFEVWTNRTDNTEAFDGGFIIDGGSIG